MNEYIVIFIDKGNCEIAQYCIEAEHNSIALEIAERNFDNDKHDYSEVSEIRIIIVE